VTQEARHRRPDPRCGAATIMEPATRATATAAATAAVTLAVAIALASLLAVGGCTQHRVEVAPIEVRPIHMTLDINIKIDRELDNFFDFEDSLVRNGGAGSTPAPTGEPGGVQ
jgi:hypothetical protein